MTKSRAHLPLLACAAAFAVSVAPAAAETANTGLLGWATFPAYTAANTGNDRPIIIGQVPNPAKLDELPEPPKLAAAPKAPKPNGTVDLSYVAGHGSPSSPGKIRATPRLGTLGGPDTKPGALRGYNGSHRLAR